MMFLVMLLITSTNDKAYVNGKNTFLTGDLVNSVILGTCVTVGISLAIRLQLKNGRFDFSLGSKIALTGIIAGNFGLMTGSPYVALIVAIIVAVILSTLTGLIYVYGRVPIVITSLGVALLFESFTYYVFDGKGLSAFFSQENLSIFGRTPIIFIPFIITIILYLIFNDYLKIGRDSQLLASNQLAAINIGIKENKNVILTYMFNGLIIGFSTIIYISQNEIGPQAQLSTAGIMFSHIVPVYMGLFIGKASKDYIGIIMAALGMQFLYYGLATLNLGGSGWERIIMGLFVFGFYAIVAQMDNIRAIRDKIFSRNKTKITE